MNQYHCCGMPAKAGAVLSGVFSIISSNMYLIFEHHYLKRNNCSEPKTNHSSRSFLDEYIGCISLQIAFVLSFLTIIASFLLLYSVYAQLWKGLMAYIIWIIFYECANTVIQIVTKNNTTIKLVIALRWFGWFTRILMHCFGIFFVIMEAYMIHRLKSKVQMISFKRCIV